MASILTPIAAVSVLALTACGGAPGVYNVTVNQGIEIQRDEGFIDVPLDLVPRPYPYADTAFPFGDNVAFTSISAGWDHVCGIRLDEEIECRGADQYGETYPPMGPWSEVYAGLEGTCGKRTTGEFECWGFAPGQSDWTRPTGVDWPVGPFSTLAVGARGICGVGASNAVTCWSGYNSAIETTPPNAMSAIAVGKGAVCGIDSSTLQMICWGNNSFGQTVPPSGTWLAIGFSDGTPCGIRTDGSMSCWGDDESPVYGADSGGRDFVDVGVRENYLCGLHEGGDISCYSVAGKRWRNFAGTFIELEVGRSFACGRDAAGIVECFGMLPEPAPAN